MCVIKAGFILITLWASVLFAQDEPASVLPKPDLIYLEQIKSEEINDKAVIRIVTSRPFSSVPFVLFQPNRLALEVIGDQLVGKKDLREMINADFLKEVSMGYFQEDLDQGIEDKRIDLIVFRFNRPFTHLMHRSGNELVIEITPKAGAVPEEDAPKGFVDQMKDKFIPQNLAKAAQDNPELAASLAGAAGGGAAAEAGGEAPPGPGAGDAPPSSERQAIDELKNKSLEARKQAKEATAKMKQDSEKETLGASAAEEADSEQAEDGAAEEGDQIQQAGSETEEAIKKAAVIQALADDEERTATGLVVKKEEERVRKLIEKIEERRRDMLFFEKEKEAEARMKEKVDFDNQIKAITDEFKRYVPALEPSPKKYTLEECLQIALNNHLPAQIALEKIKLAKIKLWEARRNIFPKMAVDVNKTKGDADSQPFFEEDYKVTMDQVLFDGGEVKFLLEQARVNLEVARRTYDKIKSELFFDVEEAYYNYVMAKMNVAEQRRLLEETTVIMKKVELLAEQGLIRPVDYQSTRSTYNQVQFQLAGSVKDFAMGELSLRQKMSVPNDFQLDIIEGIGFKNVDVNLKDALWLAFKYRPEYLVNKLMVEFQNYERLANIAKESFRIDFSGRYGYGGSAFQNGILHLQEQWYTGLKVTKTFGGSTVESNLIKERAFPRLGQNSRGDTYSRQLKVSLLDNLKMFTDRKQSDIDYQEAVLEVGKLEKQIETDVRDAFYEYQKAIIQVDSAYDKIVYREEDLKVNKVSMEMGEASAVQYLDSMVRLADEKSFYFQGLVNYYVAIANLNKAVGLPRYYK